MSKPWLVAMFASFAIVAQVSVAHAQVGGWLSANAVVTKPAASTTTETSSFPCCSPRFLGTFDSSVSYSTPDKMSFDIGGGIRVLPQFGVGIAVSRYSAETAANISFSVPHPLFVGRPATASGASQNPLQQSETAVHIEARYIGNLPHASVQIFAGPSHVKTTRTVVNDFTYYDALGTSTLNYSVSLAGNTTTAYDLSAWGFNVGVDAGYYLGENVGFGVLVRYSNAKVDLQNPLQSTKTSQPLTLGGLNVGGGVRFRF